MEKFYWDNANFSFLQGYQGLMECKECVIIKDNFLCIRKRE